MKIIKRTILLFFVIQYYWSYPQTDEDNFFLQKEIEAQCKGELNDFHKAHVCFFKKQIDSSFFYSSQTYNSTVAPKIQDYVNYIYGISAIQKKFFSLGYKKLKKIKDSFPYKYLVDYNMGKIALNDKKYNIALKYYTSVINSKKVKSVDIIRNLYHNLGICNLHLKRYNKAEKYLLKELEIISSKKDTLSIIYSKLDLGNLYYNQYKDTLAISFFKDAYETALSYTNIEAKMVTTQNMAIVEKNRKHYKKSTLYYTEYIKWKDTLWNRDKISQLLEKDKQIALVKKDKQIAIQKQITLKEVEHNRLFLIILFISLLFLSLVSFLYRIKIKQNKLINHQKIELENLNNTKNYLMSVISHDLRSPTNLLVKKQKKIIKQLSNGNIDEAQKNLISNNNLTRSLQHLLNNLLNWSLEQNNQLLFQKENYNLKPILEQVIYDFENLAKISQIEIKTSFENIQVNLDKESIKIVIRNLIDNALKYTSKNGTIEISLKSLPENKCCISIRDNGVGIDSEHLAKIKTLNKLEINQINRSKGIGLGLLLCTSLTKKNNGNIVVESKINEGTCVNLIFETSTTNII